MKTILVVEDESSIADNIRYALTKEGFSVLCVTTAQEGLKHLQAKPIDLVILDIGLPDANGFDVCRDIRKDKNIPIIFLTARAEEVDKVVGLEMGADDYVTKPFSPRELAARVKAIFRRGQTPASTETKKPILKNTNPFSIDENKYRISYFKKPLELTRNEYRLLKAFIENPGRVLSRDQLMDLAWESPEASIDRTVDVHIKTLRAKMREINDRIDPIETHRGLGYSFKDEW